ncbi:hypothetical protein O6H91_05G102800 [Diphasiastrum complanatum]|uniref:Uncharacterized protein n=1 Tax=Diphasiastrum complanatum TaxID=34168 RepID=A0ACC2DRJ1_DIPCM|nr:hypothetical protein O6H91_05G102800 [Diphasiastrum complanatum]
MPEVTQLRKEDQSGIFEIISSSASELKNEEFQQQLQFGIAPADKIKASSRWRTFLCAYQTLGVVFGGLATSPLYVYPGIRVTSPDENDYLGILSIIFWTLTSIGLVKYSLIVMHADNQGEGGTFALYSLLCQHANIGKTASHGKQDKKRVPSDITTAMANQKGSGVQALIKSTLEGSRTAQTLLHAVTIVGACMLIGDGIFTPSISVLSALVGIKTNVSSISQSLVIWCSAVILFFLFILQRFGTKRVSFLFSPVMAAWLVTTAIIGTYNIVVHYPTIFKAIAPNYIVTFFWKNGKQGWFMLGGTLLCVTGAEAMFADLGHFDRISIKVAFMSMVYPSLVLTYAGQTAYLIKHPQDHVQGFYKFIPSSIFWPMLVISTLSAIVASQSIVSATFSLIKQSIALDFFPRIKLIHTSRDKEGQIYIPGINYILLILCLAVVFLFQDGTQISNAFGVAVIMVMFITTGLFTLVMLLVLHTPLPVALIFFTYFGLLEGLYVSAVLIKIAQGGWLPFSVAIILSTIMFSWNYGRRKTREYEMEHEMSFDNLDHTLSDSSIQRVPGFCFFCIEAGCCLPPIISHYINNMRSLHKVTILTTIRYVPELEYVPKEKRLLVERIWCRGVYSCEAQYGYKDMIDVEGEDFMSRFVESFGQNIIRMKQQEQYAVYAGEEEEHCFPSEFLGTKIPDSEGKSSPATLAITRNEERELEELENAKMAGARYVLPKVLLKTSKESGWLNRIFLGQLYSFMEHNSRSTTAVLQVPYAKLVEVGMTYEI